MFDDDLVRRLCREIVEEKDPEKAADSLSLPPLDVLTFSFPSLLGSLYTPKFLSDLKALHCCALRVWYRSCWGMEALLRERRKSKFFMCLSGKKSEECHAEKISSPMCR